MSDLAPNIQVFLTRLFATAPFIQIVTMAQIPPLFSQGIFAQIWLSTDFH